MKRCAILLFILTGVIFQTNPAAANMPALKVQTMLQEIMAVQTNPGLQGQEYRNQRMLAIEKIFVQCFHYDVMARQALGPYWGRLNKKEQAEFRRIFQSVFQQSYAQMVLNFINRQEVLFKDEEMHNNRASVKTVLVQVNDQIPVDYVLMRVKGQWLICDISVDGVSMISNYYKSFTEVIRQESYKALVNKLRMQQKAMESTF